MPASLDLAHEAALEAELAAISAFETAIRQLQAGQYRCIQQARELAADVERVTESSTARERDMAKRSFVAELATTLGRHEASAARLVAEAERLTGPRHATLDALAAGELALAQVRSVLELTHDLPVEVADAVEQVALDAASAAAANGIVSTNADVRRRMRRVRERLHPVPLADRRARAADDRQVCLDPAPDGMAWLSLHLEAERAVAIDARLTALATRPAAAGDTRTSRQRAVDVAAGLLLGGALPDDERTRRDADATGDVAPRINVTVPVMTLLGLDDEPAELEGYGPIDPETARLLTAHAPWMRRILVHPETGAVVSYGSERYRVPADLAGLVRFRDGQCRFPGCSRPATHADLDHTTAFARGGTTSATNLAALCEHHHSLKHERWRVLQEPGGVMRWTSPAGHVLRTLPERPFMPVGAGEGVDAADAASPGRPPAQPPPIPADPNLLVDAEWQALLESYEPVPF
ncbi:DUF222 domain-containing protein [Agromyces sp. NPDC004153]